MTVQLIQQMGDDAAAAKAARVSTGTKVGTHESVSGLINFLMRERHGSPFEHNAFTFYIEAPIFVFREFMRHRIASYNEESGRYKELEPVFYIPSLERPLVQVGKTGAYTFIEGSEDQKEIVRESLIDNSFDSYWLYKSMLDAGVAREVARMALPVNIYSSMYVTMNARSLMNFLSLRSAQQGTYPSYPQAEIAMVAEQMENIFSGFMPITYKSFIENGRVAP
jgi:thymidylate synthase (FAD)